MPPEAGPGPDPTPLDGGARRATNVDELSWKKRALDAEASLERARAEIAKLTERCGTHERNLESIAKAKSEADAARARAEAIAGALDAHHPIDGALCATLIERELESGGGAKGSDPAEGFGSRLGPIVARLVAERPYLFRAAARAAPRSDPRAGGAMAGASAGAEPDPIADALEEARISGGRAQLLRYLRMRRGVGE